ncbi:MAG: pseudouridine-5'-phosphate glycosidase [Proteobacteria bacterium]|nr:pseudouridine-5'-phosphate glycosidase [Pseudomonadota bacterium]
MQGFVASPSDIEIHEPVRAALAAGRPVVALESTIITHGMPYPDNFATAQLVEAAVRRAGAVPATIAVVDGHIRVGLDEATLARLARGGGTVIKASTRDLATAIVCCASAGTTVAATMRIAAKVGIPVFATGGVGGVHRGAESSFDISADLAELGRTPVAVVCAGVKSILDIPKTLEYLETEGVPVLGYRSDEFPAFFVRSSGRRIGARFETAAEIARVIGVHFRLGLPSGLLVANPLPEAEALPAELVEACIAEACLEAETSGVVGKELTPFLLARVNTLTQGRSLAANIALIRSNAALAAEIAACLAASGN